jgi:hypothetical protein
VYLGTLKDHFAPSKLRMVFGFNLFEHCKVKPQISLRYTTLYPGNILEGVVVLNVSSPVEYTAVRVKLCGKERINITQTETIVEGENRRTVKHNYRESSCVYKQLITVAGAMKTQGGGGGFFSSNPTLTMPAGQWNYPFAIQLPGNIPPSFSKKVSDDFAEIVYFLKAYVDIPSGRDAVHRAHFAVIRPMPIAQHLQAAPFSAEKTFDVTCCFCVDKGKVSARMFMDRTLIAIDRDFLNVHFDLDNSKGEEPIESIEITLRQELKYTAQGRSERSTIVAGKNFIKKTIPGGQRDTIAGIIPINRNLVPSLMTTNILSQYSILAELNIPNATDPAQLINVIVAQTVDESNYSPPVFWNENKYVKIPKGQLSFPESYYVPPPRPAYPPQMIPFSPPPNAPVYSYQFSTLPQGLPSPMWQQQPPMVQGAPAMIQPLGANWSSGYDQRVMTDTRLPPPPLGALLPESHQGALHAPQPMQPYTEPPATYQQSPPPPATYQQSPPPPVKYQDDSDLSHALL